MTREAKRDFYNQIDISAVTDNKKFWKTVKPFISDKSSSKSRITLVEEGKVVSNESDVAETFNNFFVTITDSLGIIENENIILASEDFSDHIDEIVFKFSRHPSIQKIRSLDVNNGSFSFEKVSIENIKNGISELNPSKATTFKSIPPKLLKSESEIVSEPLQIIFNNSVEHSSFPDELKLADVSSLLQRTSKPSRVITDLSVCSQQCRRYLKGSWVLKYQNICLSIYHVCFVAFVRAIMLNMHLYGQLKNGERASTRVEKLEPYSWTFQRPSTIFDMTY